MDEIITIDISTLYGETGTAKLANLKAYEAEAKSLAGEGNTVVLTGGGPVWLYLGIAHALHGRVRKLMYRTPALRSAQNPEGIMVVYDHSAE
jgi:hypothetical protein